MARQGDPISRPSRRPPRDLAGSRIAEAEAISPELGQWARGLVERADPRGARDRAVRSAAALLAEPSRTATAKAIEAQLGRYLANAWPRERDSPAPPAEASPLRKELWRVAFLTGGEGLRFRTIYDLIDFPR